MRPRLLLKGLVAVAVVGCATAAHTADRFGPGVAAAKLLDEKKGELTGVGEGFRALPFPKVTDLGGADHTFEQYNGKILVLHFWASWCPYCRSEIPELTQLQDGEWTDQGVNVLTISTDQDMDKLKEFLKEQKLPYAVVADQRQPVSVGDQYGVSGIPVTLVLTRDGRIGARLNGAGEIIEKVKQVLAESPAT